MSEYTPTEARICIDFCNAATKRAQPDGSFMSMEEADAAFSRWLAAHDAGKDAEIAKQSDIIRLLREDEAELHRIRAVVVPSERAMNAALATGLDPSLSDAMWAAGWSLVLEIGQPPRWEHPLARAVKQQGAETNE